MNENNIGTRTHSNSFGQDIKKPGEARTIIVILLTGITMIAEISGGLLFRSMALLADGLHMAAHVAVLSINVLAYIYTRKNAHNENFSFGTGKINTLAGYTSALLLLSVAIFMIWESIERLLSPVEVIFNQAIIISIIGLIVNGICALILGHTHNHSGEDNVHSQDSHNHDHNLASAYLHVLADAMISFLAIFALLVGKFFGIIWADPAIGIIGSIVIARWAFTLVRKSSKILVDYDTNTDLKKKIINLIGKECSINDLRVWSIGPGIYSVIISLSSKSNNSPEYYKKILSSDHRIVHTTIEIL
ncbi:MAG: CDF family Co(II)/Ni(II) efflux transporter DmeF [Pseudomonadota bacterium]|nr:cation transporter [Gammaproteobacteria bacterium]MEE2683612.1 CDF family Co(II)/Ni(II) efflux transporter DmeF [Pseudomonadota bacterium]|tara:strand:- start:826 stop:1737 length:912 start_codon:yes stop_codon:yes gene_type:complete